MEKLKTEVMLKSSNCCCICQMPFIQIHHIDGNHDNNEVDNLAPLCPNHHAMAHSKSNMLMNLTPERIKEIRNKWYDFVANRQQTYQRNLGLARLKVKNFVFNRTLSEYASRSWAKTFASLDPSYANLTVPEIIDRVFSDTNPDNLKTYLQTMKTMYRNALRSAEVQEEFKEVCNAFGFDFDDNNVL
jgi:hypothetical protein